jgi:hypothetical protein
VLDENRVFLVTGWGQSRFSPSLTERFDDALPVHGPQHQTVDYGVELRERGAAVFDGLEGQPLLR